MIRVGQSSTKNENSTITIEIGLISPSCNLFIICFDVETKGENYFSCNMFLQIIMPSNSRLCLLGCYVMFLSVSASTYFCPRRKYHNVQLSAETFLPVLGRFLILLCVIHILTKPIFQTVNAIMWHFSRGQIQESSCCVPLIRKARHCRGYVPVLPTFPIYQLALER